ncbi:MAG: response regulator transcription factor [Sedimentisphaerales bacterium]|nr:response regulator transcription factor [Sedimentisphaerales bacterium]
MPVKILIADDHKIVREGLCAMFEKQPGMEIVGEAEDGAAAIRMARELKPDVVILDVSMPGMDGIDATRRLSKELPEMKIIALSMYGKRAFVTKMLEAGASGYVLKGGAFSELAEAVTTVMGGEVYLCTSVATVLVDEYVDRSGSSIGASTARLTQREVEILKLLAEGKSSKEIASLLEISVQAVDAGRRRIMQKLDMQSLADLVKFAIREGLTSIDD